MTEGRHGNDAQLVAPGSDASVVLNFSAEAIWRLCDGGRSVAAIADELAGRFNAEAAGVLPDVQEGIRDLDAAGLLEWEQAC